MRSKLLDEEEDIISKHNLIGFGHNVNGRLQFKIGEGLETGGTVVDECLQDGQRHRLRPLLPQVGGEPSLERLQPLRVQGGQVLSRGVLLHGGVFFLPLLMCPLSFVAPLRLAWSSWCIVVIFVARLVSCHLVVLSFTSAVDWLPPLLRLFQNLGIKNKMF